MQRTLIVGVFLVLSLSGYVSTEQRTTPVTVEELRVASAKAVKSIQSSQKTWFEKQTCTSCHHQLLPEISFKLARGRSIPIDETIARKHTAASFEYLKDLDSAVQGDFYIDVFYDGLSLLGAAAAGIRPNLALAASAQFIAARQLADGSWPTFDVRPPQAQSFFTSTAICAQAVRLYLPDQLKAEKTSRLARAREWLLRAQAQTTEDRAFQLIGLSWTGASESARKDLAAKVIADQRVDGGWSQLPTLPSDAYATGEVLSALHEAAGLGVDTAAYQRGVRFLLKSQQPDGSWHVKSRLHPPAPISPKYFNSDFPYEKDQFISIAATSWGLTALLHAIPQSAAMRAPIPEIDPPAQPEWIRAALSGDAMELKRLLDGGLDPNSRTEAGTTALMLAARDPEKVKLLLNRGADPNARAKSGFTALMVASRFRENSRSIRLLLDKGAKANVEKGVEVRHDASALFFAATAGDTQTIRMLLDAGADPNKGMKLLGFFSTTPVNYANGSRDAATLELLLSRGADANEVDENGISLLGWAAIGNSVRAMEVLIARGAKVNHVDKLGMTPLLYAASIDWGETVALRKLIAAGADLTAKTREGLTAFDLARNYQHPQMTSLLAAEAK